MARPVILYRLRNGVILLGKALGRFARTWNWLVGYVDNLKGDADLNAANGHITVDRTDPDNPVIRAVNIPQGGDGTDLEPDDVSTEIYHHDGESTPTAAEQAAEGKLQIKGWADGEPSSRLQLGGALSGQTPSDVSDAFDTDAYVIARCSDGSLRYVRVGSILINTNVLEFKVFQSGDQPWLQLKSWDNPSSYGANATLAKLLEGTALFDHTLLVPCRNSYDGSLGYLDIGRLTGGITIGTQNVVQIGTEWVGPSHANFGQHPYTLKSVRGRLAFDATGKLIVQADESLAQYIGTTPISTVIS